MSKKDSYRLAKEKSLEWCEKNKGWKRQCDIENRKILYKTWEQIPDEVRKNYIKIYKNEEFAKKNWEFYGSGYCKVPYGYVCEKGGFYQKALDIPRECEMMVVYKTDELDDTDVINLDKN